MIMMMHGITNAITKRDVLLLRPYASFKIEHVPNLSSYPNMPVGKRQKKGRGRSVNIFVAEEVLIKLINHNITTLFQ